MRLFRGDGATLAFFTEDGASRMRVMGDDGSSIIADPPGNPIFATMNVVWDGTGWAVAWRENEGTTKYRILLQRIDRNGRGVDAKPIVVFEEAMGDRDARHRPGIAFDGTNYFIAWGMTTEQVFATRVSASGVVLDPKPFFVSNASSGQRRDVQTWWTGSDFLVVWHDDQNNFTKTIDIRPPAQLPHRFRATRISRNGEIIDPVFPVLATQPADATFQFPRYDRGPMHAASNGKEILLTWALRFPRESQDECSYAQRFRIDFAPIDSAPKRVLCDAKPGERAGTTRALWDGQRWWVFSASVGREQKSTLTALGSDGNPAETLVITEGGDFSTSGDAVVTPNGFFIAYDRLEPGAAWMNRLFVRNVFHTSRGRAVRR